MSMFVSMFQDILISQPLKVIIIAILFALLLKKPQDEEDDVINSELARDEEWLEKNLTQALKGEAKTTDTQSHRPPDKVNNVLSLDNVYRYYSLPILLLCLIPFNFRYWRHKQKK